MAIDIGIAEQDRKEIAEALSRMLADSYVLYLKTHNFHWNVTGPMFQTLHTKFMTQYTELWNALDLIAERIRSLGYPAPSCSPSAWRSTKRTRGGCVLCWKVDVRTAAAHAAAALLTKKSATLPQRAAASEAERENESYKQTP